MNENNVEIQYFSEDILFNITDSSVLSNWIYQTIQSEKGKLGFINFIFCSDDYLLKINQQYLQHDTYTDIITFDYKTSRIESDIFISIDRVKENATTLGIAFEKELHRVIIHGVLHLLGYGDKTPEDKALMTQKENEYLAKRIILS
jgi:probable rRNA maturation factor